MAFCVLHAPVQSLKGEIDTLRTTDDAAAETLQDCVSEMLWDLQKTQVDYGVSPTASA